MTGHILTVEDPVEYQFKNKRSIVNQRRDRRRHAVAADGANCCARRPT